MHETRLKGVNDEHLKVTLERLKRRYGVAVDRSQPAIGYKESIRKTVTQRGRHKKQSGGHGQFGDLRDRGAGRCRAAKASSSTTRSPAASMPKQWIPAVEDGVRDAMVKGPLGFPVVDVAVTLIDGSYHSVDSSELAFRTAGRIGMREALAAGRAASARAGAEGDHRRARATRPRGSPRRSPAGAGRCSAWTPREGWSRWDRVEALIPEAEMQGFDAELRSLSQGLATYEAEFDHLAELNGTLADKVVQKELEPA